MPKTLAPGGIDTSGLGADLASSIATGGVASRIAEWRLSPADLQGDLDRGAVIVRTKAAPGTPAGTAVDDDVIRMMAQGKLQADSETAKATFSVEAKSGEVLLRGTADSAATVGRAIALVLDTKDVSKVSVDAKVAPASRQ